MTPRPGSWHSHLNVYESSVSCSSGKTDSSKQFFFAGGPDNEVSEVVNGRHLGLSCSSSSSRGAMDSRGCYSGHHRTGGGGLFHSAGLTVGIGTGGGGGGGGGVNSHSISSSDDLLTTDSALEEHERSSPTDMTKTLSDHEKVQHILPSSCTDSGSSPLCRPPIMVYLP